MSAGSNQPGDMSPSTGWSNKLPLYAEGFTVCYRYTATQRWRRAGVILREPDGDGYQWTYGAYCWRTADDPTLSDMHSVLGAGTALGLFCPVVLPEMPDGGAMMHAIQALEAKAHGLCRADQSEERDESLANLMALFATLADVIQKLVPEHDDAGAHFEELAVICQRAVVGEPAPKPYKVPQLGLTWPPEDQ